VSASTEIIHCNITTDYFRKALLAVETLINTIGYFDFENAKAFITSQEEFAFCIYQLI
jgi:hypothetical protein